jgi:hypothetical protein
VTTKGVFEDEDFDSILNILLGGMLVLNYQNSSKLQKSGFHGVGIAAMNHT